MSRLRSMLRSARAAVFATGGSVGVTAAIGRSEWRRQRLLILCYHGVSLADEHEWSDLYVSAAVLDRRLAALKRAGASVLPLEEAVQLLEAGSLPPMAVTLTFDDGAHDFLARAHPLLESYAMPSTLYLTTYYVEKPLPVFNPLSSYLLWKGGGRSVELPLGLGRVELPRSTSDPRHGLVHARLRGAVANRSADEQHEVARELAGAVHVDFDALCESRLFSLLRPNEVRQLNPERVSLQLHTHRHRVPMDAMLFRREIDDNRRVIGDLRGSAEGTHHFCYPSGEFDPAYLPWLAAAGVRTATTCAPGIATANDHPLVLPRFIDTMSVTPGIFDAWVSGLGSLTAPARPPRMIRPR